MSPDGSPASLPYVIDPSDPPRQLLRDYQRAALERVIEDHRAWVPDRLAPTFPDLDVTHNCGIVAPPTLADLEIPTYTPASTPPIAIAPLAGRVYALDAEADVFYGLLPGTNGTGPAMRRACAPAEYQWITSTGQPARGVYSVPSADSDEINTNPWGGRPPSVRSRPQHRWAGLR